jgi:hypothetical protein
MVVSTKIAVFWAVAPSRLVWGYECFRGLYCLHHQDSHLIMALMLEAVRSSGKLVGKLIPVYMVLQPRRQLSSNWQLLLVIHSVLSWFVNQLNEAGDGSTWHGSRGCGIGITETMESHPTSSSSHRLQCHRGGTEAYNQSLSLQPCNQWQNSTMVCTHEVTLVQSRSYCWGH